MQWSLLNNMDQKLLVMFMVVVFGLSFSIMSSVHAEVVGAHVTKIITKYTESGYASAAILVCAGNTQLSNPQIEVSSEKEIKSTVMIGDVPKNTCQGETIMIQTSDLSSITAELKEPTTRLIAIDDLTRNSDGVVMLQGMSVDGKVMVETSSTYPTVGNTASIKVEFLDTFRNHIKDVNYDITVKQNGVVVLDDSMVHSYDGVQRHETDMLQSDSSLVINVKILGIGPPIEESSWTEQNSKVIGFQTVPEFGTVTSLVLAVAIIATIITVSTRSRLIITPRM